MPLHTRSQRQPESQSRKDDSDWTSQLVATRAELATLQERYDDLRADRDRLAQTLSERMKIWKRFKRWIFTTKVKIPPKPTEREELRPCSCSSSTPGLQQQPVIKMLETPMTPTKPRSNRTGAISSPTKAASPRKIPLSPNVSILNTPRKIRISSEGSPYTRHLKRKRDENEDTSVDEMSQTQEDSQALSFWEPSTPSQRERASARGHSLSCPPTPKHPPALHSPPLTTRPRRGAEPTVSDSASTVTLPAISRYKSARGRDDDEPPTLNAEFEINPAANAGVPFAFDEIVRGRRHRHRLIASECEECRGWYAAVGPLPPRLEAPQWSSPPSRAPSSPTLVGSEPTASHDYGNSNERSGEQAEVSAHRQAVSRHRAQWERAPTPPGYWDIGFPDTQAVEKINERAAELHRKKRARVAKEAAKDVGGRYRRRA
ncbi:hypothetical protein V8E52_003002 [Russula decolorans]